MKKSNFRKWIIIILCMLLIWPPGLTINSLQAVAATTGTVTATSLNIRSGPGTTYSKVQVNGSDTFLKKGEEVTITDELDEWYMISFKSSGKTAKGYVMKEYIKVKDGTKEESSTPKPTPTPKPTSTPTPTPTQIADKVNIKESDFKISATVIASNLNVRKKPTTTSTKICAVVKNQKVTILNEVIVDSGKWYRITFKTTKGTSTGYVLSDYIKLTLASSMKANINSSKKVKIRKGAGSTYKYLTNEDGDQISLKDEKSVTITKEVTDKNGKKWFKVSFTVSSVKYSGYVLADQVLMRVNVEVTPTPTIKPTEKPNTTPTVTPQPTKNPEVSTTPTVTPTPSLTPTPTASPTPTPFGYIPVITSPTGGTVNYSSYINVYENITVNYDILFDTYYNPILLSTNQAVTVYNTVQVDSVPWYNLGFIRDGITYQGYVRAEYILIGGSGIGNSNPSGTITPVPTTIPVTGTLSDSEFEQKMTLDGFSESYKSLLRQLHQLYPTWVFEAYHTGLDWNTLIEKEGAIGVNLISNGKSVEWKSLETGAYNWNKDSFIPFDGSTWVTASKDAIAYYMDPRNFLNDKGIFQFELLTYKSEYQNATGVEGIFYNTPLYNTYYSYVDDTGNNASKTYSETFIKAAEYSGVSPYHLASRVKQEIVTGTTTLSSSVSGTVSGLEGLFNFYNIGAYHSTAAGGAVANGLKYAQNGTTSAELNALYLIPWDNPYDSIVGGAYNIGRNYISRGQNTIYLQKFNATSTSTYSHQYMANVEAPNAEAKKTFAAYSGMMNVPIVFSIPIFNNMPDIASPLPTTVYNPNNWLKTLSVDGYSLSPTFNLSVDQPYSLFVDNTVETINISATTVSKKATLQGTGYIPLQVGNNQVIITVTAENGDTREYLINVVRE